MHFSGGIFYWWDFPRGEFFMGMEVSSGRIFQRKLNIGGFARIPIRNSSHVLLSHCLLNFMHGDVKGNCLW